MAVSVLEIFKVGIGPSSSHTVGPMRAARMFALALAEQGVLTSVTRVLSEMFGSLGATGKGHGTDTAVLLGLSGYEPDTVDVDQVPAILGGIRGSRSLLLQGAHRIALDEEADLMLSGLQTLAFHSNGMRFTAFDASGRTLVEKTYYSVGGGFVLSSEEAEKGASPMATEPGGTNLPFQFHSAVELLRHTREQNCSIAQLMWRNEQHWRAEPEIRRGLLNVWHVMQACVERGCRSDGTLPGKLKVRRRAPALAHRLHAAHGSLEDPLAVLDWVNLYALAVNEENAAGGRVVTAPTNGAAGIVPAVLHYYTRFVERSSEQGVMDFLLTAGAIALLYKENASISGAEVGCDSLPVRRVVGTPRKGFGQFSPSGASRHPRSSQAQAYFSRGHADSLQPVTKVNVAHR